MTVINLKLKVVFLFLFIILYSILFAYNLDDRNISIDKELHKFSQKLQNSFNNVNKENYNEAESTSSILQGEKILIQTISIASSSTKKEQKILRDKLYTHFEPLYQMLKNDGILSFHFALKDNSSFLRMHKKESFGDDLSLIRYTYKKIKETHEEISGLEKGKFHTGYRYLFPLFDEDDNYIGAYEISYALKYIQKLILEVDGIKTEILENGTKFHKKGWKEKELSIQNRIANNETFSIYNNIEGTIEVISFLPLINAQKTDTLAYLVSYNQSNYIQEILTRFKTSNVINFIFLFLILFLLYWLTLHEEKIREERERFQLAIDSSNDGILDWNIQNNTTYFSPKWKEMLGYTEEEIGEDFSELTDRIHKDDKIKFNKEINSLLDLNHEIFECEYRMQKKDGTWIWIFGRGKVHFDKKSNAIRMVGFHSDITLKKEYESQQKQLIQELKDVATSKSDFLANMSHEIRTPMNAILGFIQILIKKESDPKKLKQFNIINNSGKSLLRIINDILDFSKIESHKMLIESVPYDIKQLFQHSQELFLSKAKEKNITIELYIDETLPLENIGDRVRIEQIISNFLSNALKFSQKNSTIFINILHIKETNSLRCEVKDSGIGINKTKLDDIFNAFTQEDTSTTRKYGGTGLGLSISKALVELMKGEIGVESELDVGSTFYFILPLYEVQIEKVKENVIQSTPSTLSGDVLIVEDNKTNQLLLTIFLEEYEINHTIANDGIEALDILKSKTFDLILMDENMPNMNGIEATKIIRTLPDIQTIPIVAVTANAVDGDRKRFIDAGMDDYISKPIDDTELERVLNKFLKTTERIKCDT